MVAMGTLIVTNGDSAAGQLAAAPDVEADAILPWRDVLHVGRLPATDDPEAFAEARVEALRVLADTDAIRRAFAERNALLARHADFDRIEIWLEHDLYDQLQLVQIVDVLARVLGRREGVFLVQADDHLGRHRPDEIGRFAADVVPVDISMVAAASEAWSALTAPTPKRLWQLSGKDIPGLPHLGAALVRFLEELPGRNGLTRTEQAVLDHVAAGERTPRRLFAPVMRSEEAEFLGDLVFFHIVSGLAAGTAPLLRGVSGPFPRGGDDAAAAWLDARLELTALGDAVRLGARDRFDAAPPDFWWGGVHVTGGNDWRFDRDARGLIQPKDMPGT